MSPLVSIIIDVVMVGLLAATIAYAIILNRQIIALRESRGEMAELIQGLNDAMARAETGVRTLKDEMDKVASHNEHHLAQIRTALSAR